MSIQVLIKWRNEESFTTVHYIFDSAESAEHYADARDARDDNILAIKMKYTTKEPTHTFVNGKVYAMHGDVDAWKRILEGVVSNE